jgi:YVTN family beta-propeller protein
MKLKFLFALMIALTIFSCKKYEEDLPATNTSVDYTHGAFVSNEGNFMDNNASISYISEEGVVTNDLYFTQNNAPLGDVLQSITLANNKAYAILNNSYKIEVINLQDMKYQATISGFEYPRHMVVADNGKGYVTDGAMAGFVRVINLITNTIESSIAVGNGPEKMVIHNNKLYVCNSGGWAFDSTVSVIDLATHEVVEVIAVGDSPQDLAMDANGNLWVLCSGITNYDANWVPVSHTDAQIIKINTTTLAAEEWQSVGANGDHPRQIAASADGQFIYYENQGVFFFPINATDYNGTEIIAEAHSSLDVHPASGEIWCSSISDFMNPSVVKKYSNNGSLLNTFAVGMGANGVVFN